jgi:hypothetical protein
MTPPRAETDWHRALQAAATVPTQANLTALWQCFERAMVTLPIGDQLRLGGEVISQLADLHQAKAQAWLAAWEAIADPQDPQLTADWLQGLVRQSQSLDLSALTAPPLRRRRSPEPPGPQDSAVGEVAKSTLLTWVDKQAAAMEAVRAMAADPQADNRDRPCGKYRGLGDHLYEWFDHHPHPIPLLQLQQQLGWPLVKLWLSLLLGDFALEPVGDDFYGGNILVSSADALNPSSTLSSRLKLSWEERDHNGND